MRLHRLRLQDVKGVRERTVDFPDSGVVVVEGPNEVGKTTLLEAFDLLLDPKARASSRSRAVRALQPVGRDVGPLVEAEFTVGAHRLRFSKRWLRGVTTELEILTPVREHLTGEAAQQRLDTMLSASLDRPLWDALRFTQAGALGQVTLTDSAVLTRALDGASGADLHAEDGTPLLSRVETEFLRYYTPTGRIGGELKAAVAATSAARDEAALAHGALLETEALLTRQARLRERAEELAGREVHLAASLSRAREHEAAVSQVVSAHEESTASLRQARDDAVRARQDLERRHRAVHDAADAASRVDEAQGSCELRRQELTAAQQQGAVVAQRCEEARRALDQARDVAELAAADAELLEARERLDRVSADLHRLAELRGEEGEARAHLRAAADIDQAAMRALETAEHQVVRARARQEAGSARVTVEALGDVTGVLVNGEAADLDGDSGTSRTVPVHSGLCIEVPDRLRIRVVPQESAVRLAEDVDQAHSVLTSLLARAGVADLATARQAAGVRATGEARLRAIADRRDDILGGRSEADLSKQADELRAALAHSTSTRPAHHPVPPDAATARAVARAAARARVEAARAAEAAEVARREHEHECSRSELAVERSEALLESLLERLGTEDARLAEARQQTTDEALADVVQAAETILARTEARAAVTGRELEETDVEGVRARLEAATRAVEEHALEVQQVRHEQAQVQGQVELVSGEGRQETYDLALAEFLTCRQQLEAVHRRARAARHLRETLGRHRDAAHSAYVRPFRDEIRRLGRRVYGEAFDVEVDDDLTIVSRTLAGTRVDFDQLSGGAKEQLGILARLAVAGLVDTDDGVPVIIDDALGYTDPARLRSLGTVLAAPGERAQVVVLTCTPERYAGVPGATTIRLEAEVVPASA